MTLWKPHTQKPTEPVAAVIATECSDGLRILHGFYCWNRKYGWHDSETGALLDDSPFWWADEVDLLKLIPEVA